MTAEEFRDAMASFGWTQERAGRRLGRHRVTIARYWSGRLVVPAAIAALVQAMLDGQIPVDEDDT